MNYSTTHMTLADFMDFVEPVLQVPRYHLGYKTLLAGPPWTVRKDEKIICCYGFAPVSPGVAEAWMLMGEEAKVPLVALREAKRVVRTVIEAGLYRRIQAAVDSTNDKHCSWVEHLGFRVEGAMKKFGAHGETYFLYVILP